MTALQKLTLRASEIRQRLNEIAGLEGEAFTDEIRQESDRLTTEFRDVETKIRAATVAGDDPAGSDGNELGAGEVRERAELVGRCDLGAIFAAAVERRSTEGAEAELQTELGLTPNQVPLELLRIPVETRAVTPAPASTGASEQPAVMPVFAQGDAAFLGVDMPSVPSGDAVFPVLTTRPTVGVKATANSDAIGETTGAFSAESLKPSRLQASFFYRRTEAARFRGMGPSLRQALSEGLSEAMDANVIVQLVTDVNRTAVNAADTFASYQKRLIYDRIDGRFASMETDLRYVLGASTLGDMAPLYKSAESPENFPAFFKRITGGYRVSPHVAAVANNKQDVMVRRGSRRDAVAPMWEGVTLIPDEVTQAKKGEIVITAVLLAAFKIIRTDGFARVHAQHS